MLPILTLTPTAPWQRNLRSLWFAQVIAMIGMSACIPFLPLYVRELGVAEQDAAWWAGIITAAPFVFSSLLTPLWGALGDKVGQKPMVIRAVAGLGITVTLMGFAPNVWVLLALRLAQGAASGFVASNNAFVSKQTPGEHVGYALGTLQTSISAGNIIGPLIGGFIADWIGMRSVFFFVGVMCVISMMLIVRNVHEDRSLHGGGTSRVLGNLAMVLRDRTIRVLLLALLVTQTSTVMLTPIFPLCLEQLGAPHEMLSFLSGLVMSIIGVAIVISAPWWGARSDRKGYTRTIIVAAIIMSLGQLSQAFVPTWHWLIPIRTVMGLAVGALLPLAYAQLTKLSPPDRRGGVMGIASSATLIGNLLGPLLTSFVAISLGLPWVFVVASGVMVVGTGLYASRRKAV
jgi:DHA1 family multidrug resistance protein-like MFS transporter